jgi:hypothetical protein
MAKCLLQAMVLVLAVGTAADAQVFNTLPSPTPEMTAQATEGVQQVGALADPVAAGEVQQAGWTGLPLPKITMPTITMPDMSSVTGPIKSGFNKVATGSKKAWSGAKEMFTFGQSDTSTINRATAQEQPSFWQRLVGRNTEPRVPQTVGEFMSQPRLDP